VRVVAIAAAVTGKGEERRRKEKKGEERVRKGEKA
jgi:hypothetical protein